MKKELVKVFIPTAQSFLRLQKDGGYYQWVNKEVSQNFKRNKERIPDVVQIAFVRLLSKDFVGRWFYKHLTDDLIDKVQAERILGGVQITFASSINPVQGSRSDPDSLWRIKDILKFANFDHERYYYTIQNHTIDSDRMLRLLGYVKQDKDGKWTVFPPGKYGLLQSMYRQGRIKPAQFTEHNCSGKDCQQCAQGRAQLRARGISLANNWTDPRIACQIKNLRWNDSQLAPFLREWRRLNFIKCVPEYILRPANQASITAGLLEYAKKVIDHEIANEFKRMKRTDDLPVVTLNNGISPSELETTVVTQGSRDEDDYEQVFCDSDSLSSFESFEHRSDISNLVSDSDLTDEEYEAVTSIELLDIDVKEYGESHNISVQRVHRLRNAALKKIRGSKIDCSDIEKIIKQVCSNYQLSISDIVGSSIIGSPVLARAELFSTLYDSGMSVESISDYFSYPMERILAAINRKCLSEMRE